MIRFKAILLAIGLISSNLVYSQQHKLKKDLVKKEVYFIKLREKVSSNGKWVYDIPTRQLIIPANLVHERDLLKLIKSPKDYDKFNGCFVMTSDDLIYFRDVSESFGTTKKDINTSYRLMEQFDIPTNYAVFSNDEKYSQYSIYKVKGMWAKFVIENYPSNLPHSKDRYIERVLSADGKKYNYYFLDKILDIKEIKLP